MIVSEIQGTGKPLDDPPKINLAKEHQRRAGAFLLGKKGGEADGTGRAYQRAEADAGLVGKI